jgi:hypothetical protein
MTTMTKDGYTRQIYSDSVYWVIDPKRVDYFVARFPFVPGYHLCYAIRDYSGDYLLIAHVSERPMQTFKTLTEALSVLRVLVANSKRDT